VTVEKPSLGSQASTSINNPIPEKDIMSAVSAGKPLQESQH
jgi:hypothetical protein